MKIKCLMVMAAVSIGFCAHAQSTSGQNTYAQNTYQTNPPTQWRPYTGDYVNHWGVGFQLGSPIGVTGKYWLTDKYAVDGAFGWSPYSRSSVEIHADFLFNDFNMFTPASGRMPVYIGGGLLARFREGQRSNLGGFRFPIGISYMFENSPFDVFAEVAPEFIFAPFTRGYLDGAVGFHYWF